MSTLVLPPRATAGPLGVADPGSTRGVGARVTIDLTAIDDNTRRIIRCTGAEVMAVVKADGVGHGAVDVARTALAAGAGWLGVTSIGEALELRGAGLRVPVLSWLNPVDADFTAAVGQHIDLAVPSHDHLRAVGGAGGCARVHLHLDTGMARDGAEPAAWAALCREAARAERDGRIRVVAVMGHLACAGEPTHPANTHGRDRFRWGLAVAHEAGLRPMLRHLAATAATLTRPDTHFDLVRIGAGLVGIDPSRTTALRAAMTLTAPLVGVRRVPAGTPVGYGGTWCAPRATTLGLVPVGYADGLPHIASGHAEVLVRGARCPVVGRISMDQLVVDLEAATTGHAPVAAGEPVTVFGPGDAGEPTAMDWADWAGSIPHELITGLGPRLRRIVIPVDQPTPQRSQP